MEFYKIPEEFKAAHPLPEGYWWEDESAPLHPGFRGGKYKVCVYWVEDVGDEGAEYRAHVPSEISMFDEINSMATFNSYEEAFHYGYTLVMLGLLQEK